MPFITADEYTALRSNPYFIESFDQLRLSTGNDPALLRRFLHTCTWTILTPDTIAKRNGERLLQILREHGLHPIATRSVTYNRNIPREFWRRRPYTLIRAARVLVDIYLPRFPSLAVVLSASDLAPEETAAARLHRLKGPAQSASRSPHHIRQAIGTRYPILNGMHAPDSALDFVADLGVFLSDMERGILLESALAYADATQAVTAQLNDLYATWPPFDFDLEASGARLAQSLQAARDGSPAQADSLHDAACADLAATRARDAEAWLRLVQYLQSRNVPHATWDIVLLGAATLESVKVELYK